MGDVLDLLKMLPHGVLAGLIYMIGSAFVYSALIRDRRLLALGVAYTGIVAAIVLTIARACG